jgi:hypothetical protein
LEGLAKEDAGIFYGHLVNFPAIWYIKALLYILWSFGIFYRFGIFYHEKAGNPE